MITHVVLFKLKDPSREAAKVAEMLRDLQGKVPVIRDIEVGLDVLKTPDRSYDISLIVKFDSLDGLEAYQVHPAHAEVADYIRSVRQSIAVVDYES